MQPSHKGILKQQNSLSGQKGGGIHWDEDAIAEHDKTRGQYQKIEEPKTPYHYASHEEDLVEQNTTQNQSFPKLDLNYLNAQLLKHAGEESEDEDETDRKKKAEFKKKRAMHYQHAQKKEDL